MSCKAPLQGNNGKLRPRASNQANLCPFWITIQDYRFEKKPHTKTRQVIFAGAGVYIFLNT